MTTPRRPPLELEELGARILPSVTLPAVPAPAAPAAHVAPAAAVHVLDGHGIGSYTTDLGVPEVGTKYHFDGGANLAGMGAVFVSGWVTTAGFVASGHAHGFLTFSNARGSVTVELLGPSQPGFSGMPDHFDFKVVGHTGEFTHLWAQGKLGLTLHPLPTGALAGPHGTFDLSIPASPKPPGSR